MSILQNSSYINGSDRNEKGQKEDAPSLLYRRRGVFLRAHLSPPPLHLPYTGAAPRAWRKRNRSATQNFPS
jgi:hypothetical protein